MALNDEEGEEFFAVKLEEREMRIGDDIRCRSNELFQEYYRV